MNRIWVGGGSGEGLAAAMGETNLGVKKKGEIRNDWRVGRMVQAVRINTHQGNDGGSATVEGPRNP